MAEWRAGRPLHLALRRSDLPPLRRPRRAPVRAPKGSVRVDVEHLVLLRTPHAAHPMPHTPCRTPHAACPMPHTPCRMPHALPPCAPAQRPMAPAHDSPTQRARFIDAPGHRQRARAHRRRPCGCAARAYPRSAAAALCGLGVPLEAATRRHAASDNISRGDLRQPRTRSACACSGLGWLAGLVGGWARCCG